MKILWKWISLLLLSLAFFYAYSSHEIYSDKGVSTRSLSALFFADNNLLEFTDSIGGDWYFKKDNFADYNEPFIDHYTTVIDKHPNLLKAKMETFMSQKGYKVSNIISENISIWKDEGSRIRFSYIEVVKNTYKISIIQEKYF